MKTALTAFVLFVALMIPVVASADAWVMDWNSTGFIAAAPFDWSLTGSSPTSLTPMAGGLPPSFTGQAFDLSFTNQGRTYGGPVATGSFQAGTWSIPTPCTGVFAQNCKFTADFASGTFNFTDPNHFALDVNVGIGHNHGQLVGLGTRTGGGSVTAAEPTVLLLSGAGLVGAAVLRRARRS
jgi:hypothetical protein